MTTDTVTFRESVILVKNGESPLVVAGNMLRKLTEEERLKLLCGDVPFWQGLANMLTKCYDSQTYDHGVIHRLGIPGLRFSDGPRGVAIGNSTAFPVPMARGATWDTALEERIGVAVGREARAQGVNMIGSVCINLPRHPAWGRVQETFSEDPILLGELGAAHTRGAQRNVMACVKHFALNSIERARFRVDVTVDDAILHEVYLPHFRRVVEEGVACVMSSYNSVNGEWAGQNKGLLTSVLRQEWGFKGIVISDWVFGLRDPVISVKAGLDIEAPFNQQRGLHLPGALKSGELTWAEVDHLAVRILATQLRHYAIREPEEPRKTVVFSPEHRALACEVASKAIVLLKMSDVGGKPLLPLDPSVSKLAVIGRLANSKNTGDEGSSLINSEAVSPYAGLKRALPQCTVALTDSDNVAEAADSAAQAEIVVVVVGYNSQDEGEYLIPSVAENPAVLKMFPPSDGSPGAEAMISRLRGREQVKNQPPGIGADRARGGDRNSVRLRDRDVEIINAVIGVNPRTIVCIVAGGAVITEEWRHKVPAILVSWYCGTEGGTALADVLLGRVDASGRLPFSIPKHEDHLPYFDPNASKVTYDRLFGQRLLDHLGEKAAYPLGYGLSYTSFALSDLSISPSPNSELLYAAVKVTNTGSREGRHVVQVYGVVHSIPEGSRERYLLGFAPVELGAGETKTVELNVSTRPLQKWDGQEFTLPWKAVTLEVSKYSGDASAIISEYSFLAPRL